jgi:hypothetical protein
MASQNLDVGTTANDGSGDNLRAAFVKARKMFAEIYGQTYTSDTQDLSGTSLAIKASQISTTNTANSGTDNYVLTYDDSSGGFTLEEKFDGDITGIVAGDGLTGDATSGDASLAVGAGTGITVNSNDIQISNNGVDHDQLANRYTRVQTISSTTSPIDLECDDYAAFNLNGNLGTVTLNLNDLKTGQVVDILLSGSDLSSAVITLADSFSTSVISKVGSASLDTSAKNLIQVVCVDDTDGAAIVNYSIATYTTNTQP